MTLKMAQVAVREVPSMKHSVRHSKALYVLNTGIECQHQPCLLVDVTYLLPLNITDPTDLSWMVLWGLAPPGALLLPEPLLLTSGWLQWRHGWEWE